MLAEKTLLPVQRLPDEDIALLAQYLILGDKGDRQTNWRLATQMASNGSLSLDDLRDRLEGGLSTWHQTGSERKRLKGVTADLVELGAISSSGIAAWICKGKVAA